MAGLTHERRRTLDGWAAVPQKIARDPEFSHPAEVQQE